MTVTPSPLVEPNVLPSSHTALWKPPALFTHNWQQLLRVQSTWRTSIGRARSVSEQKHLIVDKPYRTMRFRLNGFRESDLQQLRALTNRMGRARTPFPFYPDETEITGKFNADPTDYRYFGDFADRRFQVGARVIGCDVGSEPQVIPDYVMRTVIAVNDTQIQLDGDLGETFDMAPTRVFFNVYHSTSPSDFFAAIHAHCPQEEVALIYVGVKKQATLGSILSMVWKEDASGEETDLTPYLLHNIATTNHRLLAFAIPFPDFMGARGHVVIQSSEFELQWHGVLARFRGVHKQVPIVASAADTDTDDSDGDVSATFTFPNQYAMAVHMADDDIPFGITHTPGTEVYDDDQPFQLTHLGVQELVAATAGAQNYNAHAVSSNGPAIRDWASAVILLNPAARGMSRQLYPALEADVELRDEFEVVTGRVGVAGSVEVTETPGPSALDPLVVPGMLPAEFPTHTEDFGDGNVTLPILDTEINWDNVHFGQRREGTQTATGITVTTDVFGDYPRITADLPFLPTARSDCFAVMRFFDSRGGRAFPFWMIAPPTGEQVLSITGGSNENITLAAHTTERDWESVKYIGVRLKATGAVTIHRITSSAEVAGVHTLIVSPGLPTTVQADLDFYTAHLCRFDADEFPERWVNQRVQSFFLPVIETDHREWPVELMELCVGDPIDDFDPGDGDICYGLWCPSDCCTSGDACCVCPGPIVLECFCYWGQCYPEVDDCLNGGCEAAGQQAFSLPFIECVGSSVRWGNGNQEAILDISNGTWTHDLGDATCCGGVEQEFGIFLCCCFSKNLCPDFEVDQSCASYERREPCNVCSGFNCDLRVVRRITCNQCFNCGAFCCGE